MNLLFLTILFPILGFVSLIFFGRLLSKHVVSVISIGSMILSSLTACFITVDFLDHANVSNNPFFFVQTLFTWISTIDFYVSVSFRIDGLSLSMLIMVTTVSLLIYIYASWYMFDDPSYSRFFSYMNLFVASMVILVLADNLLLMYLGWEGVGLCSYLLIGFHCEKCKNGVAALKSFIMTRIGDMFLICAIFMLYKTCHTLDFSALFTVSSKDFFNGSQNFITLCLLVAAVSKSAQLPLQTWLADAMVAPSPVSALIHAATMVTAGVYLIVRTHNLFMIAPNILYLVGVIGSMTLIVSSCSALVQKDIKKILAYSTMSQISYMFISISIQSWETAIFHMMMHAFFKALLFLSSGSLILICCGERNIFKISEKLSNKSIPLIFFSFLVGGASLSALPIITSGFYSKGAVLLGAVRSGEYLFITSGLIGSFLTSLYTFRMVFIIFREKFSFNIIRKSYFRSFFHDFPLLILLILSTFFGTWVRIPMFGIIPQRGNLNCPNEYIVEFFINILIMAGVCLSVIYYLFLYCSSFDKKLNSKIGSFLIRYWFFGWGFDRMYEKFFIKPYLCIIRLVCFDPISVAVKNFVVFIINVLSDKLVLSENGQLRYYITSMILGLVIILLILMFL